ncbi:uncharacterized protein LOC134842224 isoform X3 [Symsagittifera roscoffensis]|uniref:uncharacterized protein LOC134842224 isoform X3 n=2 Tax=Symsagittifera roscoffensis TaxID=84072 RepID=UPI00307BB26A
MNSRPSKIKSDKSVDNSGCVPPPSVLFPSHSHPASHSTKQELEPPTKGLRSNTSSNSLSLSGHKVTHGDFVDGRKAGSFGNLIPTSRTPEMLYKKTFGGKIKQLFSNSGGGDKSSANSSKTNSLTRTNSTQPPPAKKGDQKRRKKVDGGSGAGAGGGDKGGNEIVGDLWSGNDKEGEDDDGISEGEDSDEQSDASVGESEEDSEWLESHSDYGRSGSLQRSSTAAGRGDRRRIMQAGGKAVAKSKKLPKQIKKAFLSPLSAANRNLRPSLSSSSLGYNDQNQPQQTTPVITSSHTPQITIGSGDELSSERGKRRPNATNAKSGAANGEGGGTSIAGRRTSLALSDTPLITSSVGVYESGLASSARGDTSSSSHRALNVTKSAGGSVVSEKDKQVSAIEKLFLKTLKEVNQVQKKKEDLELKVTVYRRDPGSASVILTKYEDKVKELTLVLEGYADKLVSLDPDNLLVQKHMPKLRKRANSLSHPALVDPASGGHRVDSRSPMYPGALFGTTGNDRSRHGLHQDDTRSTGSHDQHGNLDHVNKQMNASREDMEHPTEGNYASDYDIKLLQEEMQNNATQLRQKWLQDLESFKSDYVRRVQDLQEMFSQRSGDVEANINTVLSQKFSELDYDLRERNEMVEQQIAALSEDIRTIDQRSAHGIIEIEQAYNDRLTAVEARLVDIEKSHYSGGGSRGGNFIEDLKDADVVTLANRILQSLLVFLISFVFVFGNILKILSDSISTPQRAAMFLTSLTLLIVAYVMRESTIQWLSSLLTRT